MQPINKVIDFPVVLQRLIFMVQAAWLTVHFDTVIDVPVVHVARVPQDANVPVVTQTCRRGGDSRDLTVAVVEKIVVSLPLLLQLQLCCRDEHAQCKLCIITDSTAQFLGEVLDIPVIVRVETKTLEVPLLQVLIRWSMSLLCGSPF